ncbi:AAA-domain-containing protein [Hortaea werneckii]|nr:AAA-domain-containing protein [Hortaea werneckii]
MAGGHKRKLEAFDPLKSDSDDLDFDEAASSPRPRPQGRSKKSKAKSSARTPKRRRETYGDSDDDIELDSDEPSEEESFAESEESEEVERNPRTGRSVRSAAKKAVKYEEDPSDEDIVAPEREPNIRRAVGRGKKPERSSLIVKLKVPPVKMEGVESGRATRSRTGSRAPNREPTPLGQGLGTRRSSRISHDEQNPLVALTDSGKHEQVTRAGTETPEPPPSRRGARGSKALKKPPVSAIMEMSQEDSAAEHPVVQEGDVHIKLNDAAGEIDAQVRATSPDEDPEPAAEGDGDIQMERVNEDEQVVQESMDENEDDEGPVSKGARTLRSRRKASTPPNSQPTQTGTRRGLRKRKSGVEQSSDFEPQSEGEADMEENVSESDELLKPTRGRSSNDESQGGRRSGRLARKTASQGSRSQRPRSEEAEEELDPDEIADEVADLEDDARRNKRPRPRKRQATRNDSQIQFETNLRNRGNRPDYRIFRPELALPDPDDDAPAVSAVTPQRNRRGGGGGGGGFRTLFSTFGPFGGAGGPPPVLGQQETTGGMDSDSSDDERAAGGQQGVGGQVGMTPTSAFPKPYVPQAHGSDAIQGPGGGPPGLGKVKDKKALADADPLGVDPNVSFQGVGGLDDHIDRLKEMVALPLLYPEVFQRFHVTPPRGVLFHGPPGTGKTLLARALASSVSSHGKKVTFYMRKGADALSKWVGEAEKQLRLLFEEARKNQPSIIFFDEIDGLAPVRSSKQEQIHASIVATLLALMDGMDGRGQVIVIGATNRPDSVDPALRRPGRFDREFYFPLPGQQSRRAIIDIHTQGWDPPLQPQFKDQLAEITRGYGGADLRALCTEAALNAVQGTYPQIYASDKKLIIDPSKIKVLAKDFMISVNKIVPSSERSAATGAAPLKKDIEPLLRKPLAAVSNRVDEAIPRKRKATALEEAMYDERDDEGGFERETMAMQFETSRVFRPRLLIHGTQGMGQQYLGAALLSKFEGLHVQSFDLATLMKDSTRSSEAAVVQMFEEVKRHKPSVIYLPNVDIWYHSLADTTINTFNGLLRTLAPTEPVLVLGVMERDLTAKGEADDTDKKMLRDLFGFSQKNIFRLTRPDEPARLEFFEAVKDFIRKAPTEFPEPENRKKRKLDDLPVAPVEETGPLEPTKAQKKAQKKADRSTLNSLKLQIGKVMDQIKLKYRKFRNPVIDEAAISYLFDEQNPDLVTTDLNEEQRQRQQLFRPYEIDTDHKGVPGLREVASSKFYYNLEIVTIEKRLSNGYYKRPKDFTADIKRLAKDSKTSGDYDRTIKANELLTNVEVDMDDLEKTYPALVAECEAVYEREQARERERLTKASEAQEKGDDVPKITPNVPPHGASKTTTDTSGPIMLGQDVPGVPQLPFTPNRLAGPSPDSRRWSTTDGTNGTHLSHYTNGWTEPSRHEDSEMLDSQVDHQGQQSWGQAGSPGQHNTQGQRSQRSAHTQLAYGSQLDQYQNSASTTTSGKKTSDRSSGPFSLNTQLSNGMAGRDRPDFSEMPPTGGGSQIPDTQEQVAPSSQQSAFGSQGSQPMGPPAVPQQNQRHSIAINTILNENEGAERGAKQPPSANARIILDTSILDSMHMELARRSSGMSVEQLEQINAAMMTVIWDRRGEWNRDRVLFDVKEAFNATMEDIMECQLIMGPTQESQ